MLHAQFNGIQENGGMNKHNTDTRKKTGIEFDQRKCEEEEEEAAKRNCIDNVTL